MAFLEYTWFLWWILIVAIILRSFRSASSHDDEFESSREIGAAFESEHPGTWHRCPHNMVSGGHAA